MKETKLKIPVVIFLVVILTSFVSANSCLQEMLWDNVTQLTAEVNTSSTKLNFMLNLDNTRCELLNLTDMGLDVEGLPEIISLSNISDGLVFNVSYNNDSLIYVNNLLIVDSAASLLDNLLSNLTEYLPESLKGLNSTDFNTQPSLLESAIYLYTKNMPKMYGNAYLTKNMDNWTLSYDKGFNDLKDGHGDWFERAVNATKAHESYEVNVNEKMQELFDWAEYLPYLDDGGNLTVGVNPGDLKIVYGVISAGQYNIPITFKFGNETVQKIVKLFVTENLIVNYSEQQGKQIANNETTIVDNTTNTLVFDNSSVAVKEIVIPQTILDTVHVTLDMSALKDNMTDATKTTVNVSANNITLKRYSQSNQSYNVDILKDTVITGDSSWDGTLILPTVVLGIASNSGAVNVAVEVGATQKLTFSKAVKITLGGMYGKGALYQLADGTQYIIPPCTDATDTSEGSLKTGECYLNSQNGNDLIVWTYHFTIFAAYTPAPEKKEDYSGYSVRRSRKSSGGLEPSLEPYPTPTTTPNINLINNNDKRNIGITGAIIGALTNPLFWLFINTTLILGIILIFLSRRRKKEQERIKEKIKQELDKKEQEKESEQDVLNIFKEEVEEKEEEEKPVKKKKKKTSSKIKNNK